MKAASTQFKNNLANYDSFWIASLCTITLLDGSIFNWTDFESDVTLSGTVFSAKAPLFMFSGFQQKIGTEVDECKVQLYALPSNLILGTAVLQLIGQGGFDGADVVIQRALMPNTNDGSIPRPIKFDTSAGAVIVMHGNVSDITEIDRIHAEFDVKSRKELLNIPFPYGTFQVGCPWPLYGAGCTLSKTSFGVSGTVSSGNNLLFDTNLTNPDDYFDQGIIVFTGGANNGVQRTVRIYEHASGQILLYLPLPFAPSSGETFTVYPGCDKTRSTCENKFGNLIHYGGDDFIPVAQAAL